MTLMTLMTLGCGGSPPARPPPARLPEMHTPAASGAATAVASPSARFAVARTHFEAGRYEDAIPLVLALAHDPAAAEGGDSVRLGLESMNALATRPRNPDPRWFDQMSAEATVLRRERCPGPSKPAMAPECILLHRLAVDFERMRSYDGVVQHAAERSDIAAATRAHAERRLATVHAHCILGAGRQALNEQLRCRDLVDGAARGFEKVHDEEGAARARALLLDPTNGFD